MLLPLFFPVICAILWPTVTFADFRPCFPKHFEDESNIVCVCNATYCDTIERIGSIDKNTAIVITSSLSGKRFERKNVKFSNEKVNDAKNSITIDPKNQMQEMIGFGGAFTDSAGINFAALSEKSQDNLLRSYFSDQGLQYTIGRVPIASTDFSTREYSYADVPEDFVMSHFSLADEDLKYKVPYIIRAMNLTAQNIRLFASPWSAPGWMKTTGRMKGGGALRNETAVYKAYASYLVRFFEEYAKKGIPFWGMTIQNEPLTGSIPDYAWQTMLFTAPTQSEFIKNYFGPAVKNNDITKDLVVMTLDDTRSVLPGWADVIYRDPYVSSIVSGVGVHWYLNTPITAPLLTSTYKRHPDKFILATEACAGYYGKQGPILGDWFRAEQYATDIIIDMNNYVAGWTDWNLALDETGGPNWAYNVVDAPIIVNRTADEFYKQPMFYAMGHFSKFIRPGAKRIGLDLNSSEMSIEATATVDKGRRTIVIQNRSYADIKNLTLTDTVDTGRHLSVDIEAHSIVTIVFDKSE